MKRLLSALLLCFNLLFHPLGLSNDALESVGSYDEEHSNEGVSKHLQPAEAPKLLHKKTIPYRAKAAIIIDDIGYNKANGLEAIALNGSITLAVIPHSPHSVFLAREAHFHQKELMLHAPMSNISNFPMDENGLKESLGETEFNRVLVKAINSVPHISGINNHMGSLLTQQHLPMEWTMKTLNDKGLYFIDSRTTAESIAWRTAQQHNVPSLKRDVFLDNDRNPSDINKQFKTFIKKAKRRGYAIAIAHPYPETLNFLKANLYRLESEGIKLVPASTLVNRFSPNIKRVQANILQ